MDYAGGPRPTTAKLCAQTKTTHSFFGWRPLSNVLATADAGGICLTSDVHYVKAKSN